MKRSFTIALLLLGSMASFAQADTSKVEQYCQLIATQRLLSHKVTIDIDFGEEKSIWRDTRVKNEAGKIRRFNTIIDAMNYMSKDGWLFINAYPVHIADTEIYHFAFRKQFPRAELQQ